MSSRYLRLPVHQRPALVADLLTASQAHELARAGVAPTNAWFLGPPDVGEIRRRLGDVEEQVDMIVEVLGDG